ncbi:MAG TPA: ester cyclase [Streptosporangiaceae bacterium]|nr:ester cyclase [Streptosporangiaceae bacterium]
MADAREVPAPSAWRIILSRRRAGLTAEVGDFFAPGFVNHNARPGTPDGPEGAAGVFTRLWAGCSDMRFEVQDMVAEGRRVVCIGMMTGTHDGTLHGIPATHRPTASRQVHVITSDDAGLITEHLAVRDDVTLFLHLGVLPSAWPTG